MLLAWSQLAASAAPASTSAARFGKIPLYFEANRGQTDVGIQFLARAAGHAVYLGAGEARLAFAQDADSVRVVRLSFPGSNPRAAAVGVEKLPGRVNYLLGIDPAGWQTGVPTYGKVEFAQVYPGVDLVYYGHEQQLEYDFILAPGIAPEAITVRIDGADRLRLDERGDLILEAGSQHLRQHKPIAYQTIAGQRREVAARYALRDDHTVAFALGSYDASLPLVIDPMLSYSTYLGGTGRDEAWTVAVDASGSAYVAGDVTAAFKNLPLSGVQTGRGGSYDGFVAKLNPAGTGFDYLTYLGGKTLDGVVALALDSANNAYLTGFTDSTDFPVSPGAFQTKIKKVVRGGWTQSLVDAFVAKLNASGDALIYSTYLGGGSTESPTAIAVDAAGCAYVTGATDSKDFPVRDTVATNRVVQSFRSGSKDAYVTKFNAAGTAVLYSTYLGGTSADTGNAITVDGAGHAYVAGQTLSSGFPVTNAFQFLYGGTQDGFLTKLETNGARLFSTFLGGTGKDVINRIALDLMTNVYLSGTKASGDFPTAVGINRGGVFRSSDAGANWNQGDVGLLHPHVQALAVDPTDGSTVYVGNPLGVFLSTDGGETWLARNSGLTEPNVIALAVDPSAPATLYAGTSDTLFKSTDQGMTWTNSDTGLDTINFRALALQPGLSSTLYVGSRGGRVYRSTNAAANWKKVSSGLPGRSVNALALHPLNPSVLYAATDGGVYKTTNSGAHWSASSRGLDSTKLTQTIAVDPVTPDTLYAGTTMGLYKSTDAATNWTLISTGLLSVNFTAAAIDTAAPSTIYAGTSNGLVKSSDGGATWTINDAGLSIRQVSRLAMAPGDGSVLYTGLRGTNGFGGDDAFLTKFTSDGSNILYSVILGGKSSDQGFGVAVDATGRAYVTGSTTSTNFLVVDAPAPRQTTNSGKSDGWVAQISADGASLDYSFYLGGKVNDYAYAIATDTAGGAYVAGRTESKNFPTATPIQAANQGGKSDAFIAKLATTPMLSIAADAERISVHWPAPTPEFVLETSEVFGGPWRLSSQVPVLVEGRNTVTLPASTAVRYFRLKCP